MDSAVLPSLAQPACDCFASKLTKMHDNGRVLRVNVILDASQGIGRVGQCCIPQIIGLDSLCSSACCSCHGEVTTKKPGKVE